MSSQVTALTFIVGAHRSLHVRLALLLLLAGTNLNAATRFTGVVAFGDSLTDMGNRWLNTKKVDLNQPRFQYQWGKVGRFARHRHRCQ
jgi:hypothetical protein